MENGLPDGILPHTRSCFVCGQDNPHGLQLKSRVENGRVLLDYVTREQDLGWREIVHGGIAMTLLDEVMTWAAILETRRGCVAAELTTRLRAAIRVGTRLRVAGNVVGGKARLILTEGVIVDEDGRTLVTASGKYMPMQKDVFSLCADDFVADPGAIPPSAIFTESP
jgi:acyl-coenzyme A thioesterase PaaI-like protein